MALRYALSDDTILPVDDADLVRLPAMRAPIDLEYRSHEDVNGLNAILAATHCRILGRTAVGKSSVLPKLIASRSGCTVLVVTAHPLLSCSGYEFFESNPDHVVRGSGLTSTLLRDSATEITDYNLVWSSAANLVSWLLTRKATSASSRPLEGVVVFLDEAHECDAYTHVVRTMSLQLGAKSLMLVSATFEPAGHQVNLDRVRVHQYSSDMTPDRWDIRDSSAPWFHANIKDTAIMFVDSEAVARNICKELAAIGYVHHRLVARSTYEQYSKAIADLYDTSLPPVVLVLDRSYRSGFNFDVSLIIDSGLLYYVDGEVGYCRYGRRHMYNVEYVQTAGRGGRFRRTTEYYCPDVSFDTKICDLEPVEMEGAALVTRLLGYLPVRETANTVMTYDNLPAQHPVLPSLNGCTPLTYYCRDKFGARKDGVRPVKIPEVVIRPLGATVKKRAERVVPKAADVKTVCGASVATARPPTLRAGSATVHENGSVTTRRDSACYAADTPASIVCVKAGKDAADVGGRDGAASYNLGAKRGSVCDVLPSDSVSNLGVAPLSVAPRRVASVSSATTIELPRPASSLGCERSGVQCATTVSTCMTEANDVWNRLARAMGVESSALPKPGCYLKVPGLRSDELPTVSRHFPNGVDSIVDMASDKRLSNLWCNLPSHHRRYGLYAAVTRYNALNLELRCLKQALNTVFSRSVASLSCRPVRERISRVFTKASAWEIERTALYKAIGYMAGDKYNVTELPGTEASESARTLLYERKMRSIRDKRIADETGVDDWLGQSGVLGPLMITDKHDKRKAKLRQFEDGQQVRTVYVKPCIGVSRVVEYPEGHMDIIPSRMVRRMSGCSKVTVSDVQIK